MGYPEVSLPCPECRERGVGGKARIGNRRSQCVTCNRFNQRVLRESLKRLKERFAKEYVVMRLEVERDLYPQVIQEFSEYEHE